MCVIVGRSTLTFKVMAYSKQKKIQNRSNQMNVVKILNPYLAEAKKQ
jgi:hypothetical protein